MWPILNFDGYRRFLHDILQQEGLDPRWRQRNERICAIIDAMTRDERRTFLCALDRFDVERIARDSGVPELDVVAFLTWYISQVPELNYHRRTPAG